MKAIIKDISEWQEKTFPNSDPVSKWYHLKDEINELEEALFTDEGLAEELADCMILLIGIAAGSGVDIQQEIINKMEVNKKRKWGTPDSNGVVKHIEEEP